MHYRLNLGKPLQEAVPAIATGQLDAAIACLKSSGRDHKAVHSARKHFKRVRALLGLVESAARGKKVKASQKLITSAAHSLAPGRDAKVALGAAESLAKDCASSSNARAFSDLTSFLMARRERAEEKFNRTGLEGVLQELETAKAGLAKLDLRDARMSDLLKSVTAAYARGRRAMKAALDTGGDEPVHTWRKHAQRHWRHMLLLKAVCPKEAKERIVLARRLSEILGEHNDLAVLRQTILANRIVFRTPSDVQMLCRCIETRQKRLARKAASHGARLYAAKPGAFSRRFQAYWQCTKRERAVKARPQGRAAGA